MPGGPDTLGDANGPGIYDPRQWGRELRERINELRDIQQGLGRNNPLYNEYQGVINALQNLERNSGLAGNPQAIERLAQQIIDPLKSIELELSRELQILLAKENIRSAQEDDIPTGYEKFVEEYYRKLTSAGSR
jgi:hypothetical protein